MIFGRNRDLEDLPGIYHKNKLVFSREFFHPGCQTLQVASHKSRLLNTSIFFYPMNNHEFLNGCLFDDRQTINKISNDLMIVLVEDNQLFIVILSAIPKIY